MVCVIYRCYFHWSLGGPWVVSNDVWASPWVLKQSSGRVLTVSGHCRKNPGAFLDVEMETVIYVAFFSVISGGPWVVSSDVWASLGGLEHVSWRS